MRLPSSTHSPTPTVSALLSTDSISPNATNLTFEQPDTKRFRNLALAYEAMYRGGNMPCIVNAANEVVVASFLKDGISFLGMSDVIEKTMERVAFIANPTYDDYVATDAEARKIAASLI